jgi:hypothetical protein
MLLPIVLKSWLQRATFGSVLIALVSITTPTSSQSTGIDPDHQKTATPSEKTATPSAPSSAS